MIAFPNCKINLGLHIVAKRADGYHDLETVFYPVPLYDVLEIIQTSAIEKDPKLWLSGLKLKSAPDTNLCVRAYQLLKKDFPDLPLVEIFLHKNIPAGGGLGGGSADAAFMLSLLNEKFRLGLGEDRLLNYALQLGSDCPFFILNKPCFAAARGEQMERVDLNLSPCTLVLVNPRIHIETKWAFAQIKPTSSRENLRTIISRPVEEWKHLLQNDFEQPVFSAYPEIAAIKNKLYESGAIYAAMSGSGSSVFGIFNSPWLTKNPGVFPAGYFVKEVSL